MHGFGLTINSPFGKCVSINFLVAERSSVLGTCAGTCIAVDAEFEAQLVDFICGVLDTLWELVEIG